MPAAASRTHSAGEIIQFRCEELNRYLDHNGRSVTDAAKHGLYCITDAHPRSISLQDPENVQLVIPKLTLIDVLPFVDLTADI